MPRKREIFVGQTRKRFLADDFRHEWEKRKFEKSHSVNANHSSTSCTKEYLTNKHPRTFYFKNVLVTFSVVFLPCAIKSFHIMQSAQHSGRLKNNISRNFSPVDYTDRVAERTRSADPPAMRPSLPFLHPRQQVREDGVVIFIPDENDSSLQGRDGAVGYPLPMTTMPRREKKK